MALSKTQLANAIAAALVEDGVTLSTRSIKDALDGLAMVAEDQIAAGNDFIVPGVTKIVWTYRKPQKKGERWKKGDTVTGFGGIESVKDVDSPSVTALVKIKGQVAGNIKKLAPRTNDPVSQKDFLRGKAGKAIIARKG